MPVKRPQLTRQEQTRYLECAKELQAAGLEIKIPDDWQENSRTLDIFVAPLEGNLLCELSTGVTACAIHVELISLRSNLILKDPRIASDWDSELILLCGDRKGLYRAGAAFQFSAADVLNHRIQNGLRFHRRGDVAEGWIVATSSKPIPDNYRGRMITKLSLTFTDQFGYDHSAQGQAILERSARLKEFGPRVRHSQGLFEVGAKPDIGFRETGARAI